MCLTSLKRLKLSEIWDEERPRMFLWSPVAMGVGICGYFAWPTEPNIIPLFYACLAAFSALFFARYFHNFLLLGTKVVFFVVLGFTLMAIASRFYGTPQIDQPIGPAIVTATILDIEQRGLGRRLLLEKINIIKLKYKKHDAEDIEQKELPQNITPNRIHLVLNERISNQAGELQPGQRVSMIARLMPLSEPMSPNGFDFRRNNFFKSIGASGYVTSKIRVYETEEKTFDYTTWFARSRKNLQAEVKKTLEGDSAGLAIIFLTGDQSNLSEETATAIRAVGLAHLLSISGLHIGLAAGEVFFFIRALLACSATLTLHFPIKKWAAFFALMSAIFYTLQVGAPVATKRSLLMAGIVLLGIMFDRISISLRTVMLVALIILVFWPQMLLHPSFQLSFAAVIGLVSVGEWIRRKRWRPFSNHEGIAWTGLRYIINLGLMSFAATVATLPFILFHFHEVGIYSMIANTLAIPLTSIWLMPMCVLVYLLWPLGATKLPLLILESGADILIWLSKNIANLPGAHLTSPPMPESLFVIAVLGGLVFCLMTGRVRMLGLAAMVLAVTASFFSPRPVILINPEGDQVGWRRDSPLEMLVTSTRKPDKFLANYWGPTFGVKEDKIVFVEDSEEIPMLSCNEERCVFGFDKAVAWIKKPKSLRAECEKNHAVIINPKNDEICENSNTKFITKETLFRHGAHAIYFYDGDLKIKSSKNAPSLRPWSTGWKG